MNGEAVVLELVQQGGLPGVVEAKEQNLPALVPQPCAPARQGVRTSVFVRSQPLRVGQATTLAPGASAHTGAHKAHDVPRADKMLMNQSTMNILLLHWVCRRTWLEGRESQIVSTTRHKSTQRPPQRTGERT